MIGRNSNCKRVKFLWHALPNVTRSQLEFPFVCVHYPPKTVFQSSSAARNPWHFNSIPSCYQQTHYPYHHHHHHHLPHIDHNLMKSTPTYAQNSYQGLFFCFPTCLHKNKISVWCWPWVVCAGVWMHNVYTKHRSEMHAFLKARKKTTRVSSRRSK